MARDNDSGAKRWADAHLRAAEALLQRKADSDRAFERAVAEEKRRTDDRLLPGSPTWRRWIAARSAQR